MKYYFAQIEDSNHYSGPFDSIEEARKEAETDGLESYYIGEEHTHVIQPNSWGILENIAEELDMETYEDAGEMWMQNINDAEELGDELDEVIREFLKSKNIPTSVTVIKYAKHYRKE